MVPDKDVAAKLKASFDEAYRILDDSAALVRQTCNEEEINAYIKAIGPILYEIGERLMDPLYKQHPELKPNNWI
jgi:hypothetical protein